MERSQWMAWCWGKIAPCCQGNVVPQSREMPTREKWWKSLAASFTLLLSISLFYPSFLSAADTGPNKIHQSGRRGVKINCFLQVQRAIPALRFMGVPVEIPYAGWSLLVFCWQAAFELVDMYCGLKNSSRAAHCAFSLIRKKASKARKLPSTSPIMKL